jgi:hypothetical protein
VSSGVLEKIGSRRKIGLRGLPPRPIAFHAAFPGYSSGWEMHCVVWNRASIRPCPAETVGKVFLLHAAGAQQASPVGGQKDWAVLRLYHPIVSVVQLALQ